MAAARLLPYLGDRVMHRDEALAVMVARRPLGELLETVQLVRGGAPLHFLLAKLVAELGGGLVATRAVSAIGLLIAIVAVGLLGSSLGGPAVGAAAAWIVALSPVALFYGDFARMYSLFLAFSALALWCLVRALETNEPRFWAGTAGLLVLTTYTHPYGVVVGLVAALAVVAELVQLRDRAAWRLPLYAAAGVIAGTAPLAIGYLVLASRLDKVPQPPGASIPKPSLADVAAQAGSHFVGVPRAGGLIALYLVVCGALALVGLVTIARGGAGRAVLVAAWIVLPLGVLAFQGLVQGGLQGAITMVAYSQAVILLGVSRAVLFPAIVPAVSVLVGIPIVGEIPSALQIAGLGLVTIGLLITIGVVRRLRLWRLARSG